ncbi:MAG TPA: TadE/TadG family type IV pilus assembly protein [Rhizobiaceae bacterium]|nr:TadE/TadG family type IV pilus assembly protein [Rhizobiaceae bacterium]
MRACLFLDRIAASIGRWRNFLHDGSGAAALEFALVAPLLLACYFVTMEVGQAIETSKKVGRVASTVADLITRQQEMTSDELKAIMGIGQAIVTPYGRSAPTIIATGIQIDNGNAQVAWSRKLSGGSFVQGETVNTATQVPEKLRVDGTFLVRVTTTLHYRPVLTWSATGGSNFTGLGVLDGIFGENGGLAMGDTYYLRPRQSASIACSGC